MRADSPVRLFRLRDTAEFCNSLSAESAFPQVRKFRVPDPFSPAEVSSKTKSQPARKPGFPS